jgi:RHS repeat-associated protein
VTGGVTQTYSYPGTSNKLASVSDGGTPRTFTYDANGNIATDFRVATPDATFTYNQRNRNAQVTVAAAGTTTYQYNALGERVSKSGTSTTQYQYDEQGHLIAESNGATGAMTAEYVWLNDQPLAQISSAGVISYIHPDHLNTPQKMTDATQAIVFDRVQQPFGEPATTGSPGATNNLRFPGQYADAESLLNYNLMRDYDPTLGRYIESDPIGLYGATIANMNIYGYASQNSLRYVDTNGLIPNPAELTCVGGPNPVCMIGLLADIGSYAIGGVGMAAILSMSGDDMMRNDWEIWVNDIYKAPCNDNDDPNEDKKFCEKWYGYIMKGKELILKDPLRFNDIQKGNFNLEVKDYNKECVPIGFPYISPVKI